MPAYVPDPAVIAALHYETSVVFNRLPPGIACRMGRPILFRCPTTGMNVQHWLADEEPDDSEYDQIACPACTRFHFIRRTTGKPIGQDD